MQTNRNIHARIYKLSSSKAPKTQQICQYSHGRKASGPFLLYDTGVGFSSHNNFANLGSFAKVSVPVGSIIPWSNQGIIDPIIPWSNASTISVDMTIAFIHDKYIRYSDKYYCQ